MASDEDDELEKMVEAMKIRIMSHSIAAVDDFENIVNYSTDGNLNPKTTEQAAELLADWIKSSCIFQQTRVMERTRTMSDISKTLLSRHFSNQFSSGFSLECLFSTPNEQKITNRTHFNRLFYKKPLPQPMAFGVNNNGKLGVGVYSNKTEEGFQPVQLKGNIEKVYIGENHSIFVMNDGEYYGVGRTKNFLHEPKDEKPFANVPIVLDYINSKRNKHDFESDKKEQCELSSTTTFFRHFHKHNCHLVVGKAEYSENNWEIVSERLPPSGARTPVHVPQPNFLKEVTLPHFNNPDQTVNVSISKGFIYSYISNLYQKIHMFFCGKKFTVVEDSEEKYGKNGLVWVNHNGTLYHGQLEWAPLVSADKESSENYGLVAIMEEVLLEYQVEKFAISEDGKSVIVYNCSEYEDDEERLSCINTSVSMDNWREYDPYVEHDFERDFAQFKHKIKNEWKHELYTYTGLPSFLGEGALPPIQTLRRFMAMDEEKKVPVKLHETFKTLGYLYKTKRVGEALDGHFCDLVCESAAIKPIVVEAGWSEEERDERNKQISLKVSQYFEAFVVEIEEMLEVLKKLPLIYQQTTIAEEFKNLIAATIWRSMNEIYLERKEDYEDGDNLEIDDVVEVSNGMRNVGDIVKERIQKVDIDENDERFKLIRVEAIGLYDSDYTIQTPYVCSTTLSHIKIIDMELLAHIENGVLNLNKYSIQRYEPKVPYDEIDKTFRKLMNAFFFHSKKTAARVYFIDEIDKFFRPDECYTVECNDGKTLQVPSIFFQIYSNGFDAARRRNADREGKNSNEFKMDLPKRLVKKLVYAMIDPRIIQNLEIEDLLKILEVSQYWLFTDLQPKLVTLIVQKTKGEHYSVIQQLFQTHPNETIDAVAAEKPEIMVYWKDFPMSGNYLKDLNIIISKFPQSIFVAPLPLLVQKNKTTEQIPENWLLKTFVGGESDKVLLKEFKKTVTKWQGYTPSISVRTLRKRRNA